MDLLDGIPAGSGISSDAVPSKGFQTASAYGRNLTCITVPHLKDGEGNIHTGAIPPWLRDDNSNDEGKEATIGPSFEDFKKYTQRMKKINQNPNRVGANFERDQATSEEWLPSFGRVWNQGPRWQSRHEYRREGSKRGKKSL